MSVPVMLKYSEVFIAAVAGCMRQIQNLKKGRAPRYGAGNENDWQLHIEGCLGELVIAKWLGAHWSGKGTLRAPDVGRVDVRTRSKQWHDLILHPEDPDDRAFWLVCGGNGKYSIKGWILARDGKKALYWKDPAGDRPAYFVPQESLQSPHNPMPATKIMQEARNVE